MMILFVLFVVLLVFWGLAFFRVSITGWGLGAVLTLFFASSVTRLSDEVLLLCGLGVSVFFVLLGVPWVRRALLSGPLFRRLQRTLPTFEVPLTEMGTGGWEGELFNGQPDWKHWLSLPQSTLTAPDQQFLQQAVQPLCEALAQSPRNEETLDNLWQAQPFARLCAPQDEGGAGLSMQGYAAVVSTLARCDRETALQLEAQPLQQAARHLGEMRALGEQLPPSVPTLAHAYVLEGALQMVASACDNGTDSCVLQAIIRQHSNQMLRQALSENRPDAPRQVWLEGVPTDLTDKVIFSQGMLRLHPYVFREISALQLNNTELAPLKFDAAAREHLRYSLSTLARCLFFALSSGVGMLVPGGPATTRYYQRITRFAAAFALCCEVMVWQTAQTARRQPALFARLGEIFAGLYVCAAALKHFEDNNRPKEDLPLLEWALQDNLYQVQQTFVVLLQNLPKGKSWWLRRVVFPWGASLLPPADPLGAQVLATRCAD